VRIVKSRATSAKLAVIIGLSAFLGSAISPFDDGIQPEAFAQQQAFVSLRICNVAPSNETQTALVLQHNASIVSRRRHPQDPRKTKSDAAAELSIGASSDRSPPRTCLHSWQFATYKTKNVYRFTLETVVHIDGSTIAGVSL
jgi:hypothetical protein